MPLLVQILSLNVEFQEIKIARKTMLYYTEVNSRKLTVLLISSQYYISVFECVWQFCRVGA